MDDEVIEQIIEDQKDLSNEFEQLATRLEQLKDNNDFNSKDDHQQLLLEIQDICSKIKEYPDHYFKNKKYFELLIKIFSTNSINNEEKQNNVLRVIAFLIVKSKEAQDCFFEEIDSINFILQFMNINSKFYRNAVVMFCNVINTNERIASFFENPQYHLVIELTVGIIEQTSEHKGDKKLEVLTMSILSHFYSILASPSCIASFPEELHDNIFPPLIQLIEAGAAIELRPIICSFVNIIFGKLGYSAAFNDDIVPALFSFLNTEYPCQTYIGVLVLEINILAQPDADPNQFPIDAVFAIILTVETPDVINRCITLFSNYINKIGITEFTSSPEFIAVIHSILGGGYSSEIEGRCGQLLWLYMAKGDYENIKAIVECEDFVMAMITVLELEDYDITLNALKLAIRFFQNVKDLGIENDPEITSFEEELCEPIAELCNSESPEIMIFAATLLKMQYPQEFESRGYN